MAAGFGVHGLIVPTRGGGGRNGDQSYPGEFHLLLSPKCGKSEAEAKQSYSFDVDGAGRCTVFLIEMHRPPCPLIVVTRTLLSLEYAHFEATFCIKLLQMKSCRGLNRC